MSACGKFKKGTVVAVAPEPDTPTDEMSEKSPFSMPARPADCMPTVSPVGIPPGFTTRKTTRAELAKVDGSLSLGGPNPRAYVEDYKKNPTSRSIKDPRKISESDLIANRQRAIDESLRANPWQHG